jgi:hypothetical protein
MCLCLKFMTNPQIRLFDSRKMNMGDRHQDPVTHELAAS